MYTLFYRIRPNHYAIFDHSTNLATSGMFNDLRNIPAFNYPYNSCDTFYNNNGPVPGRAADDCLTPILTFESLDTLVEDHPELFI